MSFFQTSEGTQLEAQTEYEISGFQKLVPDGTLLKATISGVTIEPETNWNNEFVGVELMSDQKGLYGGYTFNHKLHVNDDKQKKADKAIQTLLTYDTNCKGGLLKSDKAGKSIMDIGLLNRALTGNDVVVKVSLYEIDATNQDGSPRMGDDGKQIVNSGNYISGVYPKTHQVTTKEDEEDQDIMTMAENQPNTPTAPAPVEGELLDSDDIPF